MYQRTNYSLEIISRSPDFNGKSLRKYAVEGIETVGAFGNEPFEIKFTNHTYNKIQVKLSLDGTDILTGETATSEPTGQMWVVNGKETLNLKAWPETKNGGAAFIFTSADKSVAVHTHGDLSHRGIIAAAVFTEGHVEPVRLNPVQHHHHHHHNNWWSYPNYSYGTFSGSTIGGYAKGSSSGILRSQSLSNASNSVIPASQTFYNSNEVNCSDEAGATMDCLLSADAAPAAAAASDLRSLASVGAGSYTEQQITYVAGLIKPLLSDTVRVKYVWWDDLVAALRTTSTASPHPSGFPGDKPLMSIGSTPRYDTREQRQALRTKLAQELQFSRF